MLSTGDRVEFSIHAVERAVERMLPAHTPETAWGQIAKIVATMGQISVEPPAWVPWQRGQSYLLIGDDVVFPLASVGDGVFCAKTALVRGQNDHVHGRRRDRARRKTSTRREAVERRRKGAWSPGRERARDGRRDRAGAAAWTA